MNTLPSPEDSVKSSNSHELDQILLQTLPLESDKQKAAIQIVDSILRDRYGFTDFFLFEREREKLIRKLHLLLEQFPGINLKDKIIVDLGCGNNGGTAENADFDSRYQPWFCRILQELGAKPIGIDMGNLDGEPFEHFQEDLAAESPLKTLPPQYADAVFADDFYHSPQLIEMKIQNRSLDIRNLRQRIFPAIKRVLKSHGFYVENDLVQPNLYNSFYASELDHESYCQKLSAKYLKKLKGSPESDIHTISMEIARLVFPYMMREHHFAPTEENAMKIESVCSSTLYALSKYLNETIFTDSTIVELHEKDSRMNEPWAGRFLEMLGIPVDLIQVIDNEPQIATYHHCRNQKADAVIALHLPFAPPPSEQNNYQKPEEPDTPHNIKTMLKQPGGVIIRRNYGGIIFTLTQ
ncbi:hypothetical protein KBB06_03125 [Candidatus Gracilibacteria bacterium]|nr:hypothetical protein [Candidatus Gracilibacteria bacterium]